MKTNLFFKSLKSFTLQLAPCTLYLFTALCSMLPALSQIPQGFNYQAIARDGSGNPIADPVNVRIDILSDDDPITVIREELFSGVDPNDQGLFSLVIGTGTYQSGVANFSDIDWSVTPKYIKTWIYYLGEWKDLGAAQLWSVPYAMIANGLAGPLTTLQVTGDARLGNHSFGGTNIELNTYGTGNRYSFIDFHGDDTYTDYALRLIRNNSGINSSSRLHNRGLGGLEFYNQEAAPIRFFTSSAERLLISNNGNIGIGNASPVGKLSVQVPTDSWDDNIPLFEVKNKKGIPVFSVYNYGVRILVDHTDSKAVKGGFAVSGYDYTKAGGTVNLMTVNPDSIRFNISNSPTKGYKGGFAVGSFADTKGPIDEDFMYITPQNSESGQYNTLMGYQTGYSHTSFADYNSFFGYQAGFSNLYGDYNTFLGYQAGYLHEGYNVAGNIGRSNIYIGHHAAYTAKRGTENCIIGYEAGMYASNGSTSADLSGNTFIGYRAGKRSSGSGNLILGHSSGFDDQYYNSKTSNGSYNIILGNKSGGGYTSASDNVLVGVASGFHLSTGTSNVAIGTWTGYELRSSSNNVILGYMAGQKLGSNQPNANNSNVILGYKAGNLLIGTGNVLIGNEAGRDLLVTDNQLFIDNSSTTSPLIWGDFSNGSEHVRINGIFDVTGRVGIGVTAPGFKLDVRETLSNGFAGSVSNNADGTTAHGLRVQAGSNTSSGAFMVRFQRPDGTTIGHISQSAANTVAYNTSSDIRLKENLKATNLSLQNLLNIKVYDFNFIGDDPANVQTGFIAQNLYEIIPSAVSRPENPEEVWMVDYSKVSPLVVKAIQDQQALIEAQNEKIENLEKMIQELQKTIASASQIPKP